METPTQQENDLKELLLEYDQLRKEILHNEVLNTQTMTAILVVVSALMGVAFSQVIKDSIVRSALFFIAEIVAFIGILQITDRGRITFMIASYLRIFTEEKLRHLKWETRLTEFRRLSPKQGYGEFIGNNLWIYTFIAIANFALGTWYVFDGLQNSPIIYIAIAILIFGLIVTIWIIRIGWGRYNRFVFKYQESFDPIWIKVRNEEKEHNTQASP